MQIEPDEFEYAIEHSHILHEPARRIDTFGATRFKFIMISQLMDNVSQTRIRKGEMQAQKPQLITPSGYNEVGLEGFNDKAKEFIEMLRSKGMEPSIFQYGFQFKRSDAASEILNEQFENVKDRAIETARAEGDPMLAVIECVDDAWEIGLLKFSIDMVKKSSEINAFDFKRKGLI